MSHTIETPEGKYIIYNASEADDPDSHEPNQWYYRPVEWAGGPYSKGHWSSESAEEACWEHSRKGSGS